MKTPKDAFFLLQFLTVGVFLSSCGDASAQRSSNRTAVAPRVRSNKSVTNPDAAVTRILARHFKDNGPGVAVLVADNGVVQLEKCYGLADIAQKKPITPQSVFDLASLSKEFTATAALLLISEGKLSLKDPISKVLPDFHVPIKGRAVTVGDLIYHISGLADYVDDWDEGDAKFNSLTTKTHLKWLNETEPRRAPGRKWEYNNSGYALLALVIEKTSGMPLSQFLRMRLFVSTGMSHTIVHDKLTLYRTIPTMVTGYKRDKERISKSSQWTRIVGDGNVLTSIEDMVKWDRALRGNSLLSNKQKQLAWSTGRLDNGQKISDEGTGYGFGWNTDEDNDSTFHTGSWMGTSTYIVRYLKSGLTIVVLSNDENADVGEVASEVETVLGKSGGAFLAIQNKYKPQSKARRR